MDLDEYKGKHVMVTGGLGLIGSTIALRLVELGARILIVDSELPLYGANHHNISEIKDKIKIEKVDIRDQEKMNQLVQGVDIIFNMAGQVDYTYSLDEPFYDLEINCKGHLTVLEACRKHNPEVVILYPGSRLQYGDIEYNPVDEKHPMDPKSVYGIHKITGEKYYLAYHKYYGLKTIAFRISNPYGPRSQMKHHKYSIINWFLRKAMDDEVITIFGDGEQKRDYVFVEDVAEIFIRSALNPKMYGEAFNLGSGIGTSFLEMVQNVVDVVGKGKIEKVEWPKTWKHVESGDYVSDISKLKKFLDFEPKFDIKEGLKKTFEFYKDNREKYW
jgi:UDP-glucose 4-epimerase